MVIGKGVDSHLPSNLSGFDTRVREIVFPQNNQHQDYPLVFINFLGNFGSWRFRGGAPYTDLKHEAEMNRIYQTSGVKSPKVDATIPFPTQFCMDYGLPLPANDRNSDKIGESLHEYLQRCSIDYKFSDLSEKSVDKTDKEYKRGYLHGQNIRRFRNIWRVHDLEKELRDGNMDNVRLILDFSQEILSQEFPQAKINFKGYENYFSKVQKSLNLEHNKSR